MKSKVLLSMLMVLIVLTGLWVMSGTIFMIREVEVIDDNLAVAALSAADKAALVDQTAIVGKNILFNVNQTTIKNRIKILNPQLKVQAIKAEFPNRVVINVARRVPIYCDQELCFDAEMCVIGNTATAGCVDISGAQINLSQATPGNLAVGATERDQRKLEQLKIVAGYFDALVGWKINYQEQAAIVGANRLSMQIMIGNNLQFVLQTTPDEDFAKLLAYTYAVYKTKGTNGVYQGFYGQDGKAVVYLNQVGVFYEA